MTSNLFLPKGLKLISGCPICGHRYNSDQAKVIEEKGDAHLIHIECQKCQGGVVAVIVQGTVGVSSMGIVTDLTAEEVTKFKEAEPVTQDDCLKIHKLLESDYYEFIDKS